MATVTGAATLVKEQIHMLNEAVFIENFKDTDLNQFHKFHTGIKGDREIVIMNNFFSGLSGQGHTGCTPTADDVTVSGTTKNWTPKYINGRIEECFDTLLGKFLQWGMANGFKKEDLTDSDWVNFLKTILPRMIKEVVMRKAWFDDTAIVSGTNNNIAAGNIKYFDDIDGLWKQILAIVAADSTKNVAIAKNAGATYALQRFDATDVTNQVVTGYFNSAWYGADLRLRDMSKSDLIWVTTQTVFDQYEQERKKVSNIELPYVRVEKGIDGLQHNGVDVIPFSFLDRTIDSYFRDDLTPTKWINPHRAILMPKWLLNIGTEDVSNLDEFDIFHDKKSKKLCIDYGFMLDAKIVQDHAIMTAY